MQKNDIICEVIWNNQTQDQLDFSLRFYCEDQIHIIGLCFTSHMRIGSLRGAALMERQGDFHHIKPKNLLYVSHGDCWMFSVDSFASFENTALKPQRLCDGPTGAYVIYEQEGKERFINIDVDFRFTHPKLPVIYSEEILALSANAPTIGQNNQKFDENGTFLPNPAKVVWSDIADPVQSLRLNDSIPPLAQRAHAAASDLADALYDHLQAQQISGDNETGVCLNCILDKNLPKESYVIDGLDDGGICLRASDYAGFLYGFITLYQYLMNKPSQAIIHIKDYPRFSFRGCHLDVARIFQPLDQIQRFLQKMAWLKLNILHLHFCDDEAWRIEIDAYPELTEIGAFRGHHHSIKPSLGSSWKKSGGFYPKAELRALIHYAQQLNIEIIPEFDMPGHHHAALQSLPWLREEGKQPDVFSVQGFNHNCLNPGLLQTYEFMENVIAELVDIFPHPYFHLGGDEVPYGSWMHSPACKQLAKEQNFIFTTANLQSYLLRKAQDILHKHNKLSCAWQEAADGFGLDRNSNAYLTLWKDTAHASKLLAQGYNLVISPGSHYYLDMAQDDNIATMGLSWAGHSDIKKTYMFEPLPKELEIYEKQILGIQACIWGENMHSEAIFNHMVFPRLYAIAETAWTMRKIAF